MELKQSLTPRTGVRLAVAMGVVGALALGSPAYAEAVTIPINPGNVPTTAADFEDQSCENLPADLAANVDGWVFVLPAAAGVEGNFISVTATYKDANGAEQILSTEGDGAIVSGSGDNKAYILTPAGWTLVDAEAEVEDPADDAQFNLTHACAGTPSEEETSPGEEPTSPGEEPTSPGEEPTVPGEESSPVCEEPTAPVETDAPSEAPTESGTPCEEATSPAGSEQLPTTGTPLTIALVSAAALAAGGAAVFMVLRRRRAAQDW